MFALSQVQGHVEQAETLLGIRVVDEPAATMAVSRARGEIAIGRLSIRKAKEAVDRAEEEERCVVHFTGYILLLTVVLVRGTIRDLYHVGAFSALENLR